MFSNRIFKKQFEFYYLVELTRERIKPLSRWEKPVNKKIRKWLRRQGFFVEIVPRKTLLKRTVFETVFSLSSRYVDYYYKKFVNASLRLRSEKNKMEGFLFGYPSCCVQQFIQHPYHPNHLRREDQSLLFHWACDGCRVTPDLVSDYRKIYNRILGDTGRNKIKINRGMNQSSRMWQAAAAAVFSTGCLSAQITDDMNHFIPLPNDMNQNGLAYAEEIILGRYNDDSHQSCHTYAQFFKARIDSLPDTEQTDRAYKIEYLMRGVVQCEKCDAYVNMGYVVLVHPLRHLELEIPYLGLHFMENGYFSWGNNAKVQRVDIDTLKRIIFPYDPAHMLPVDNDTDQDGLTDAEEDSLWMEYYLENKDFNGDSVPDGAQIAEELVRLFPNLKETQDGIHSHIELQPVWGMETCQVCGTVQNMGSIIITNPENQRICQIPFMGLHALAHGSFAFNGTVHQNQRMDAISLYRAMKTHMLFIQGDADQDGLEDHEEKLFGFDSSHADSDQKGICDGPFLALNCAEKIMSLPTEPVTTGSYAEFVGMDGVHLCAVCGKEIVMGIIHIYNPLINMTYPFEISYYAFHFLKQGSFAYEGAQHGRIDPVQLLHVLNMLPTRIHSEIPVNGPVSFSLEQNHPNPFNFTTAIHYRLFTTLPVTLSIYNLQGQKVKTLICEIQEPGEKQVRWNGTGNNNLLVSDGIYFCRIRAGTKNQSKKMILLK